MRVELLVLLVVLDGIGEGWSLVLSQALDLSIIKPAGTRFQLLLLNKFVGEIGMIQTRLESGHRRSHGNLLTSRDQRVGSTTLWLDQFIQVE